MKIDPRFEANPDRCTRCGRCINVCTGMVLRARSDGVPEMQPFERCGWRGCWRCQHCLAAYPTGAVSIFSKKTEDSLPPPPKEMGTYMEELIASRRSYRRYQKKNVNPALITRMLKSMAAAPTGGNCRSVGYTVIDDKDRVKEICRIVYKIMEKNAKRHIYTGNFGDFYYAKMKESKQSIRKDDMLFCGASHLFIAHTKQTGKWGEDVKINCDLATAYLELLAGSFGLGTIIMSCPAEVIEQLAPVTRDTTGIPADRYMWLIVGFGYLEIPCTKGVQKDYSGRIHRYIER